MLSCYLGTLIIFNHRYCHISATKVLVLNSTACIFQVVSHAAPYRKDLVKAIALNDESQEEQVRWLKEDYSTMNLSRSGLKRREHG